MAGVFSTSVPLQCVNCVSGTNSVEGSELRCCLICVHVHQREKQPVGCFESRANQTHDTKMGGIRSNRELKGMIELNGASEKIKISGYTVD